jgi:Domain of unknown function (DUF6249)
MQHLRSPEAGSHVRRLVLGVAFAVGLAFAMTPHTVSVRAADLPATIVAQADTSKAAKAPAAAAAPGDKAPSKADAPKADAANADNTNAEDSDTDSDEDAATSKGSAKRGNHGIFIEKGGKKIRIEGLGGDRDYDSFEDFVHKQPRVAVLFFVMLMVMFLLPLLIVVLLIWYKLRKNRLANETMLKLAERGVVPPATAMEAVASGTAASVAAAATPPPTDLPAYEQARYLRRRAVWSDLRKGVILCAVGLGLSFWSILDDGTPNSVGLVLLFVGIGYCVLWFFEDRTTAAARNSGTPPPGSV